MEGKKDSIALANHLLQTLVITILTIVITPENNDCGPYRPKSQEQAIYCKCLILYQ